MDDQDESLNEIINSLMRLQALKIERVYDMVAEEILMTFSFETMQEIILKRDQEIAFINAETEKELRKYKVKN